MSIDTEKVNKEESKESIYVKRNRTIDRTVFASVFNPVTKFDVYLFTNQFRTSIDSGVEITKALAIIEDQTHKKVLKDVIRRIRFRIMQGSKISTAMSYYPWMFDKIYVASIKVGEENGQIAQILLNLETSILKQIEIDRKFIGACIYPTVAFILSIVFAIFTFKYIMPGIMEFIGNLDTELPWPTKIVLFLTDIASYPYASLIAAILICILVLFIYRYIEQPRGKYAIDYVALNIPVINSVVRKMSYSSICRNIATLLSAGIPITTALKLCGGACHNAIYAKSCESAASALEDGEQLSEFFANHPYLYDTIFTSMFVVGEESGNMPELALCLADMYDRDLDSFFNSISSIIEPVMIVFVGGVIGFIVLSVFLPLYSIFSTF